MTTFTILTIFPKSLESYTQTSLLKRAQEKKLLKIKFVDIRDYAKDKHRKVDDVPFGGGPGMVMKIEPIYEAVRENKRKGARVILMSPQGKLLTQTKAKQLSKYKNLIFICGRYEGVDERVAKHIADENISIGDYVLSGGELPAMVCVETIARYIPGVLGKQESLEDIKGSYPVYTRPQEFRGWKVPPVLLTGNHKKIERWRKISE